MLRARTYRARALAAAYVAVVPGTKRANRTCWAKPFRREFSHSPLVRTLQDSFPEDFQKYLRMDSESFEHLLKEVGPTIQREDTQMRQCFSSRSRLVATLKYLATGCSFEELQFMTGMSPTTLRGVIPETCKAIFDSLKAKYMKFPTTEAEWIQVADGFEEKWDIINCGGALDGKHIRIQRPPGSGAKYYNYKGFYSIVLMALVNSNYEFLYVDVGKNGRLSDGGVIEDTTFFRKLCKNTLNLPQNNETKHNFNFIFLGDEAFPLEANLIKPYSQIELDYRKRVFNYRLSRGRNVVEDAFGMITKRFGVLQKPIHMKHERICYVVLAICTSHNYLRRNSKDYSVTSYGPRMQEGQDQLSQLVGFQNIAPTLNSYDATDNREKYKTYFNTVGAVAWQNDMVRAGRA